MDTPDPILWRPPPDRIASCALTRFACNFHGSRLALIAGDPQVAWQQLHHWSLQDRAAFWSSLWTFAGVIGDRGQQVLEDDRMPGAQWFRSSKLNYAENLLAGPAEQVVLVARDESSTRRSWTRDALRRAVLSVAAAFVREGIGAGDVVAGYVANTPEALVAMLATAHLGAVWTSTSPEFGAAAVLERFGQTGAKLLVASSRYRYGGSEHDCVPRIAQIARELPGLRALVLIGAPATQRQLPQALCWDDLLQIDPAGAPRAVRVAFDAPLFILYSSGTTGKPKAIVHGVGGTLLQHRKEHLLHTDIRPGDRMFFYTTCGWMMWNWLVSALANQATVVLFDGSPVHPDPDVLWRMAAEEQINVFGTSPRYLATIEKAGLRPRERHDLGALRTILCTGSPLLASQFDYVYEAIGSDLHLASISGGTDIVSCFCLGVPWLPVRRGEIQGAGLGMAVEVLDESGTPVVGTRGELACMQAFPCMPLGFLGDADGARYRRAYFERFPGLWHHGDFAVRTPEGGFVILGRSDAVLNPGGVRIGTAEIYRQVEQVAEVAESLAIGQQHQGDERIVLFVKLAAGATLDAALEDRIRRQIRANASPRHVPARIIAVADLPRTMSGKLVELAVRDVVHGLPVQNREALANPQALDLFLNLPQLTD